MQSLLKNLCGVGIIALSIYLSLVVHAPALFGVFHLPSFCLVVGLTVGVSFLIIEAADIRRFLVFLFGYSASSNQQRTATTEKNFETLAQTYVKEGGEGFRREVSAQRMPSIWRVVATKLAINVPIPDVKDILDFNIHKVVSRLDQDITTLRQVAILAPALGMFGTVLGLIRLLADLKDMDALGGHMSLALLTTLYGIFVGNVVLVPLIRSVEKRKAYSLKDHANLVYWLDHVERKKPSFYLKENLRDLDVKTT